MSDATIIQALGGPAEISRQIGVPLTTVDSWKRSDRIPHWRRPALAELALAKGLALPDGFVSAPGIAA